MLLFNIQKNYFQDHYSDIDLPLNVKVKFVLTDEYHICCLFSRFTNCLTDSPWYFSCNSIFLKKYVKTTAYFVSTLLFTANLISLLLQRFSSKSNSFGYYKIVTVINLVDITYSIYLTILLIGDIVFPYKLMWKASPNYLYVITLFLNFTISSPVALFLFTLCRLMVIKYPLETRFRNPQYLLKCILFSLIATSQFTIIISILMQYSFQLPSPFCSTFVDPSKSVLLVKMLMWFIVLCKFLATGTILFMYIFLWHELHKSQRHMQKIIF